jgi:hypothetical protein
VTVPAPVPALLTVSDRSNVNVAVTVVFAVNETTHVALEDEQPPPDHPVNADPAAGFGVNVTEALSANWALQPFPQVMPPGLLVTVPTPLPAFVTVSV